MHLLFWLSLIPFATSWIGENHVLSIPVAFYAFILLMSGFAYFILQVYIIKHHEDDFALKRVVGKNIKGKLSIVIYIIGIFLSFLNPWLGIVCYITVAIMRVIPDKRIEINVYKSK